MTGICIMKSVETWQRDLSVIYMIALRVIRAFFRKNRTLTNLLCE